ncbi:MAG: extracellular solute-binding protein [Alphaproteobacteria bacterium]|nr:extracellular solute-binding protein [Alphaproteobacteria bacterium]
MPLVIRHIIHCVLASILLWGKPLYAGHKQVDQDRLHGVSLLNGLKYKKDFKHFDYVNPTAPKGGIFRFGARVAFDSLNPFIVMGNAAFYIQSFTCATLLQESEDEPASAYAYLADGYSVSKDGKEITFYLNQKAKFSDHKPITAHDIVFTFNALIKHGSPLYRNYYKNIDRVEVVDTHTLRFHATTPHNKELILILGQLPALPKHFYDTVPFDQTTLIPAPSSGPYQVESVKAPHRIVYKKVGNWWGQNIPSQVGHHHFDQIEITTYRDDVSMFEAFKKGLIHVRIENSALFWTSRYNFPAAKSGLVKQITLPNYTPRPSTGFFINTRNPILQDKRIRKALNYALDFNWLNTILFHNLYTRNDSYYSKSYLSSEGRLDEASKKVLKVFAGQLPKGILNQHIEQPFYKDQAALRQGLKYAQGLLVEAGYTTIKKNVRYHRDTNKPLSLRFIYSGSGLSRFLSSYQENLKRIGIHLRLVQLDANTYTSAVENFDYDLIHTSIAQSPIPGPEQRSYFGSDSAHQVGGRNYSGIQHPVVDALIEKIIHAQSDDEKIAYTKALDFVLLSEYYMVPAWHFPGYMVAYWTCLKGFECKQPPYPKMFFQRLWFDQSTEKSKKTSSKTLVK